MINDYLRAPVNYGWVSFPFTNAHQAVDIGWRSLAGPNQPILASGIGEVVEVNHNANSPEGLSVIVRYEDTNYDYWLSNSHMNSIDVAVGTRVTMGQQLGTMGNTGNSNGEHTHFRVHKVPHGTRYSRAMFDNTTYRVDPRDYVYLYPGQEYAAPGDGIRDFSNKPTKPFKGDKPAASKPTGKGREGQTLVMYPSANVVYLYDTSFKNAYPVPITMNGRTLKFTIQLEVADGYYIIQDKMFDAPNNQVGVIWQSGIGFEGASTPKPKPQIVDRTGQTLVIHEYAGIVPLWNTTFTTQYPVPLGAGRLRRFKIERQVADGKYIIKDSIFDAPNNTVGIIWQSGIGFE